jgi:uncharacterized damage-inducible protein DinB
MTIERVEPPHSGSERQLLEAYLDYHRQTLLHKCDGLSDDQLKQRAVNPSNLSLLGLVRHMTEVELHWFSKVMPGAQALQGLYWTETEPDGDFDLVADADVAEDFRQYHRQVAEAKRIAAGYKLDDLSPETPRKRHISLRWIYIHMIEEYARHNGHADLIRESIDGATGE